MFMASLFQKLHDELAKYGLEERSRRSRLWFTDRVKSLTGRINRNVLLRDEALKIKKTPMWGYMYMFAYDPKTKEDMPYYDKFPLIIMVDKAPGGFYGLNLHYLAPNIRALFLDRLVNTMVTDDILTERSRIRLRYQILKGVKKYREFAPCFKHYLFDHMKTRASLVPAAEWDIAIFLPTEHFSGASKTKVWAESRKQYLKQR